jgi:hypothetical protein
MPKTRPGSKLEAEYLTEHVESPGAGRVAKAPVKTGAWPEYFTPRLKKRHGAA